MNAISKPVCTAAAVVCFAAALWIYAPLVPADPYHYDEADYMWAGKQGLVANYTERNGLSFFDFVSKGLELWRHPGERQSFSEYIRASGDIGLYRHYHGPAYAYWLALVHNLGVTEESVFRGSGLLIHGASAFLILFGFWAVFPSLPPPAGLAASVLFIFNRTALSAATTVTQHVVFTFLCLASLFAMARFLQKLEDRWFYATMAAMGLCLCAVETSVLLFPALGLALLADFSRVRQKLPSAAAFLKTLLKGVGFYLLAIFVFWPKGVLQLGMAKGIMVLAYFAVTRRNFSPTGPLELFSRMFLSSPWEFSFLMAGTVAAFFLWRKSEDRRAMLPWLAFIAVFFAVLLKMTLPYTYYFAPLTAALTVACGLAVGELLKRRGAVMAAFTVLAVAASVIGTTAQYSSFLRSIRGGQPFEFSALKIVRENPASFSGRLYLPFQLVPTMHYYFPELKTTGYDASFPIAELVDGVQSADSAAMVLCEEPSCAELGKRIPGFGQDRELINPVGPSRLPFYAVPVRKP